MAGDRLIVCPRKKAFLLLAPPHRSNAMVCLQMERLQKLFIFLLKFA
jgi:hypothetical protein